MWLKDHHELANVTAAVSTDLELAALCRQEFSKSRGGRALLFHQLKESSMCVAANLFGSEKRLCALLGTPSLETFGLRIREYLEKSASERNLDFKTADIQPHGETAGLMPADQFDLSRLPGIRTWPGESGRHLTLALVATCHPLSGKHNLGLYRVQIISNNTVAVNFAPGSDAAAHLEISRKCGLALPVSLILGVDPALLWVAAAPLPEGCDEYLVYRDLFSPEFSLARGVSQPLALPRTAEMVIEGEIRPFETVPEGPFGNHTGQYVSRSDCPLMHVTAVQKVDRPIIPVTVVGPPPSENIFLAKANEILIREMLKKDFPQISEIYMPQETFFHGAAILTVKPQSKRQIRELIHLLWRGSPLRRSRLLVLLDEDIDIRMPSQCWWRVVNRLSYEPVIQENGRFAIDATGVDPLSLVGEDRLTQELLQARRTEYNLD
ncbi:MAG: UbiD family decarboxylase [Desulfuromonadales bacterium]|nr:UbiD family decarboxylase [Desulfuromonadales bacterium]MBN2791757.1 UbiD family decarboxylase [Desulfuromonadales bacterium]